ncbi:hypothetical protein PIROE2DRAFT_10848 [Piromyces sp. E2]|nr:hypothetical protein PIROE2DRAFT_10848 [Piromyces sp. E2]|eukprot:OUM62751.1 hypothetical protein PIROE2DRAFT_10848 [Piromyces sp. E2]
MKYCEFRKSIGYDTYLKDFTLKHLFLSSIVPIDNRGDKDGSGIYCFFKGFTIDFIKDDRSFSVNIFQNVDNDFSNVIINPVIQECV